MKTPSWIQNIYPIPAEERQWPELKYWLGGFLFYAVFFMIVPWIWGS